MTARDNERLAVAKREIQPRGESDYERGPRRLVRQLERADRYAHTINRGGRVTDLSEQNVKIVRAGFEAWNAGDMDALRELYDPGIIWRPPEGAPEPGPYVGREAVMRQLEQLRETWDADTVEPISDFIEVGDRVAVRYVWHGAGHGPEMNMESTGVYTVRKGRVSYIELFWDHAEALETMGLSGQDADANSS